jgi:hypothetical protein
MFDAIPLNATFPESYSGIASNIGKKTGRPFGAALSLLDGGPSLINIHRQCCGSGSRSPRIRNFLNDLERDPELKDMEPYPAPDSKLYFKHITKNHKKSAI